LGVEDCVLVISYCYNKIPFVGQFISNRNELFIVLEARKSKIKVPADSMSGEGLLFACKMVPSDSVSHGEGDKCCVLMWQKGEKETLIS
jgi:hypothetical protein